MSGSSSKKLWADESIGPSLSVQETQNLSSGKSVNGWSRVCLPHAHFQ